MKLTAFMLLALLGAQACSASLMAIDLGSEFVKVSLIKAGRTPISIVVNEMSKRKSPALVGLVNGERLIGEEALSLTARFPESIFGRLRDFIGRKHNDPIVKKIVEEHSLPYEFVEHPSRGMVGIKASDGKVYSMEELLGSVFHYVKTFTAEHAGAPVVDTVLAVPAWFSQVQRQAMVDAAELAGLNVIDLINSHAAAALQYGIERDFADKPQKIVLYNMGSSSTEVALVQYSTYSIKEAGKPKTYNQLEVLDVEWDASLGSNDLDMLLTHHFADAFNQKFKLAKDVRQFPKAMAKLKKQVRRTKEILSANSAAPISVEELHDGLDFQSSITREQFENLAGSFWERAGVPLKTLLDRNGLKGEELDAVELLGGGSRVPRVQGVLSELLGGRVLDRHLDADEAIAMGAGLFAANLSTSFRLRKFGLVDGSSYGLTLSLDELHQEYPEGEEPTPTTPTRNLFPHMKKLPIKRTVHLHHIVADPIRVSLAYNTSTPHPLPPGVTDTHLAAFEVTGVADAIARYNTSGTINLKFEGSWGGLVKLAAAEAAVEYEVMEEKIVEVKDESAQADDGSADREGASTSEGSNGEDTTEGEGEGDAKEGEEANEGGDKEDDKEGEEAKEGEAAKEGDDKEGQEGDAKEGGAKEGEAAKEGDAKEGEAKPAVRRVLVAKKKTAKVVLSVSSAWSTPPLSGEQLASSRQVMADWLAAETIKRENARAKNDLEAYIIKMRDELELDEVLKTVTTEEQRTSFSASLSEAEDWLYDEGEAAPAAQFRAKLKALRDVGEPMVRRAKEYQIRPQVVDTVRTALELKEKVMNAWPETKPWIEEAERSSMAEKLSTLKEWLSTKTSEQASKADHEDPVFSSEQLYDLYQKFDKAFERLNNKKKPKHKEEPKVEADGKTEDGEAKAEGADSKEGTTKDEAKNSKEGKSSKDSKDKSGKDSKEGKAKDSKGKDSKEGKGGKDSKEGKGGKDKGKESKADKGKGKKGGKAADDEL